MRKRASYVRAGYRDEGFFDFSRCASCGRRLPSGLFAAISGKKVTRECFARFPGWKYVEGEMRCPKC